MLGMLYVGCTTLAVEDLEELDFALAVESSEFRTLRTTVCAETALFLSIIGLSTMALAFDVQSFCPH